MMTNNDDARPAGGDTADRMLLGVLQAVADGRESLDFIVGVNGGDRHTMKLRLALDRIAVSAHKLALDEGRCLYDSSWPRNDQLREACDVANGGS